MSFKEDDSRIRSNDSDENVAVIRRWCLNLCKLDPRKNSMAGKIKSYSWSDKYREEVFFGQSVRLPWHEGNFTRFLFAKIDKRLIHLSK